MSSDIFDEDYEYLDDLGNVELEDNTGKVVDDVSLNQSQNTNSLTTVTKYDTNDRHNDLECKEIVDYTGSDGTSCEIKTDVFTQFDFNHSVISYETQCDVANNLFGCTKNINL